MVTPDINDVQGAVGARYEVLDVIGTGGMGAVFRARHRELGHLVAIKVLPPEIAASKVREMRFRREAQLAAHLSHPNVVPVYEFESREGITYLVMPFVQGHTLQAMLVGRKRLPLADLLRILKDVGAALDFIHPRGIVHRDVKPPNILIEDETDRALLADFGVALAASGASSLTGVGGYVGTPAYSAPEQLASTERVDGRADLFALALVAFEALAGELPAAGLDRAAIAAALHQRRRDVPVALARALVAPLAERPDQRPATAAAWLANVGASVRGRWRRPVWSAAVVVLSVAIWIGVRGFQKQRAGENSLAMMPFTLLGTSAQLPPAQLPPFFLQRLGSVPRLRIISESRVHLLTGTQPPVISEADSLATQLGATYFVQPSLELQDQRARLSAQLYATRGAKLLATGHQEGSLDSLSQLMDAVWAQVLPAIVRHNFAPVSNVTLPRGLAAILSYARGEDAFRHGDYASALDDYNDVIAADSTFALAYFRRALVIAQVDFREESMRGAIAGAQRHQSGLTPADSLLLEGYGLLLDRGDGRRALQRFQAAADLAPDEPQTWLVLGEFYFHYGALFDQQIGGAEDAFTHVRDLTPGGSATAIAHLISLAHMRGDKHATAELIAEYEAFNTQSVVAEAVGIADTLLLRGLPARAALLKTLDNHSFTALEYLVFQAEEVGTEAERTGPARRVLRALERRATTDSQQVLALRLGVAADLGEGWTDSARARLARVHTPATERERDRWLVLLAAVGRDSLGGWRDAADRLGRSPGSGEMGHWMLARLGRDRASHMSVLERLAADSSPLPLSLKLDLDARRALAAGDTVLALQLWHQATERYAVLRVPFGLVASLWWLRLDLARVAVAHGDTALARRTCDSFASLIGYVDLVVRPESKTLCAHSRS